MESNDVAFRDALWNWGVERSQQRRLIRSKGTDADAKRGLLLSVTPGLYEHFKSKTDDPKFYIVHCVALRVDENIADVVYTALYGERAGEPASRVLWTPQSGNGFVTPIDRREYRGPRFSLVTKLDRREIDILLQYVGEFSIVKDAVKFRIHVGDLLKRRIPSF
ncbi:MAG: hypothetical protein Q8R25_03780 [bacterium]|nr:hypothetical protein [bacterium]